MANTWLGWSSWTVKKRMDGWMECNDAVMVTALTRCTDAAGQVHYWSVVTPVVISDDFVFREVIIYTTLTND